MRFILFQVAGHRYALEARQVSEILPIVAVRPMPGAPTEVAGLIDLRGTPVPVVDLTQLIVGRQAEARMSTRLVIVRYPQSVGEPRLLGLLAEKVAETIDREPADFTDAGIASAQPPCFGPVARHDGGFVQWMDVARLLPPHVRDVLFQPSQEAPWSSRTSKDS